MRSLRLLPIGLRTGRGLPFSRVRRNARAGILGIVIVSFGLSRFSFCKEILDLPFSAGQLLRARDRRRRSCQHLLLQRRFPKIVFHHFPASTPAHIRCGSRSKTAHSPDSGSTTCGTGAHQRPREDAGMPYRLAPCAMDLANPLLAAYILNLPFHIVRNRHDLQLGAMPVCL